MGCFLKVNSGINDLPLAVFIILHFFYQAPGAVGHLSFTEILDTSLKVSWSEPGEKNGVLTGNFAAFLTGNKAKKEEKKMTIS